MELLEAYRAIEALAPGKTFSIKTEVWKHTNYDPPLVTVEYVAGVHAENGSVLLAHERSASLAGLVEIIRDKLSPTPPDLAELSRQVAQVAELATV